MSPSKDPDTTSQPRAQRASSFAGVAAEYERGRPGYPRAAITWLLGDRPHWPSAQASSECFADVQDHAFAHEQLIDRAALRDLASSRSSLAIMPAAEREPVLAGLDSAVGAGGRTGGTQRGAPAMEDTGTALQEPRLSAVERAARAVAGRNQRQ